MRNAVSSWIAEYEGERMIALDDFQHDARRALIRRAAEGRRRHRLCITYGNFRDQQDPLRRRWKGHRSTGIAHDLGCISLYEHQHGRPLPTAAVTLAGVGEPSAGFWDGLCRDMLGMDVPPASDHQARTRFWEARLDEFADYWTTPGITLTLTDSIDVMVANATRQP
jgi:hypothetical protein